MKTKVKKDEVISREDSNGIVVMKWQDRREVRLLTTNHGLDIVDLQKNGCYIIQSRLKSKNKKKRVAAVGYNQGKSNIDLSDQYTE